jgi:hypothetical protein
LVLRGAYRQSSKWRMSRRKSERRSGEGPTLDRSAVPPDVAALIGKAPTDTSRLGRQFLTNIKRSRHRRAMVNPRGLLLALPLGLGIDGWCICTNYIQIIVGILVVFFVLWCICTITNNRRMIDAEHLADLARAVAIRSQFQDRLPVALGTRRGLSRPHPASSSKRVCFNIALVCTIAYSSRGIASPCSSISSFNSSARTRRCCARKLVKVLLILVHTTHIENTHILGKGFYKILTR